MAELGTGGFLSGRLARQQSDRADATLGINQMNANTQQVTALQSQLKQITDQAAQTVQALDQSGIPRTDPRFQKALAPLAQAALRLAGTAEQSRLPGTNGLTDTVTAQFKNLYLTPTPEQAAVTEGTAKAAGEVAGARTIAAETGAPEQGVFQQQGLIPTPEGPQTDIGKLLNDQQWAVSAFGADSPQAAAIQEAIDAEQAGEPFKLSDVSSLRKEFVKESGAFISVRDAFGKVQVAANNPSAAGDLAMIFNFMKMLDPASVVREGEFATAQNAAGVPARARNLYNRVLSGERLNPEQRADFLSTARNVMGSQLKFQTQLEKSYRGIAERQGMPTDDVIVDFVGDMRNQKPGKGGPIGGGFNFATMGRGEILGLTPEQINNLTPEQAQALDARMKELGM